MIQQQTILKVSDNSGGRYVKCIKVLGGFKRKYAVLGDTIVVSVQKLRNRSRITSKIKKGEIYRAVIIRTKSIIKRKNGVQAKFKQNCVCMLNKNKKPIGSRIIGPIAKELRVKRFAKLASISAGFAKKQK